MIANFVISVVLTLEVILTALLAFKISENH